tara:strand:- start:2256 stop:3362 length:1107 start_codon:yes stop_codon:yes gene_type:complete
VKILVTGSAGFIGKNLVFHLNELKIYKVIQFTRNDGIDLLQSFVDKADAIIHLAGENRPNDEKSFDIVNTGLTKSICSAIKLTGRKIPLIFASSIQAKSDNPYGNSKRNAELALEELAKDNESPVFIYRLPNVFGKWCKPNYNSVVATFCHNIANDLPIKVNSDSLELRLVYIDDVIAAFIKSLQSNSAGLEFIQVDIEYSITLAALVEQIKAFKNCRNNLISENVGNGLIRALYATYISYLPKSKFSYEVPIYGDDRGVFVEILKTKNSGQFSFFKSAPGVTRGDHYHHSKTEKFIVVKGAAQFNFRNLTTNEVYKILTSDKVPEVVESIPGWAHNITNVGKDDLIVMLWANEIFNRECPDTIPCKV